MYRKIPLKENIIGKEFTNKSLQKENKKKPYIATFVLNIVDFTNFQIKYVEKWLLLASKRILLY